MHSSASSSVIVSNTGKIGTFLGEIIRKVGATSIQELKHLTPFAIVVTKKIAMSCWLRSRPQKFQTESRKQRDPVVKISTKWKESSSSFAGEVRLKIECMKVSEPFLKLLFLLAMAREWETETSGLIVK